MYLKTCTMALITKRANTETSNGVDGSIPTYPADSKPRYDFFNTSAYLKKKYWQFFIVVSSTFLQTNPTEMEFDPGISLLAFCLSRYIV